MENLELEFKYKADSVSLTDFDAQMKLYSENYKKLDVSSWDAYFFNETYPDRFLRLRMGQRPEFTIKVKSGEGVQKRTEINVSLVGDQEQTVSAICKELGYEKNIKIYKSCFIYFYNLFNTVYYTVYNEEMKEIGRFIEIEFDESRVADIGEAQAFEVLKDVEKDVLGPLGITHKNRLQKSLFDMYRTT